MRATRFLAAGALVTSLAMAAPVHAQTATTTQTRRGQLLYDALFAKLEGKPVDQTTLQDAKAKVADAKAKAQAVPGSVIGLQPAGYPDNRSTLVAARQSLQTARQDLLAARQDVAKLVR